MGHLVPQEYVARHNEALASRDWSALAALFGEDAELAFEGLDHPPVRGRAAIAAAFAARPPDDALLITAQRRFPHATLVRYAWCAAPERAAGTLRFELDGPAIRRLTITTATAAFCVLYRFRVHQGIAVVAAG